MIRIRRREKVGFFHACVSQRKYKIGKKESIKVFYSACTGLQVRLNEIHLIIIF